MPSQLKVVFLVPTKRDWLSLNGKKELDGELIDDPASETNIKLPITWIINNGITDSFFGMAFSEENKEQIRACDKKIQLKYFKDGKVESVEHTIFVKKKTGADYDYQIHLHTRGHKTPLWRSNDDGGLIPTVEDENLLTEEEIATPTIEGLQPKDGRYWPKKFVLWFGKCEQTGEFWHGVLTEENIGAYPDEIKRIFEEMYDSRGRFQHSQLKTFESRCKGALLSTKMSAEVLGQIKNGETNILLYGPPGTGKTYALQEFRSYLDSEIGESVITIDETRTDAPLQVAEKMFEPAELNMPGKIKVWWTTFHQGVTYEDFVVGLRPRPEEGGITLEPRAGILLEAMEHARGEPDVGGKSTPNTSVIIIDELNRGNVEAILGDFITAMDKDYRAPYDQEEGKLDFTSRMSIPMIFNNINGTTEEHELGGKAKKSENVSFASTGETKPIPLFSGGYKVPQTVIIVGTMNSVDRSIKPLDNALERRFVKVRCDPEYGVIRGTAAIFGHKLLETSNDCIIREFPDDGMDKTIGHSLMMKRKTGLNTIQECYEEWRKHVVPVLIKRFKGRHQQLRDRLSKNFPLLAKALKDHLPDQEKFFKFEKVLKSVKGTEGSQNKYRDFVCKMLPEDKKDILANLIENGVFEDTLFEHGEEKKEFSITDGRVEWQQTTEEDGTVTEPTEVPEEEWNDWESVFTGKTLRQVVESNQLAEEPEEDDFEDVNMHLDGALEPLADDDRAEAVNDIHLLRAHNTTFGFKAKADVRRGFRKYLTEEEKQNFDAADLEGEKIQILEVARKARTQKWIEKMGGTFIGDNKKDRRRVRKYFKENGVVPED